MFQGKALEPLLDLSTTGVTGRTLGDLLQDVIPPGDWQSTIRTPDKPLGPAGSLDILYGSLAPDGAVIKTAAASKGLLQHRGPAVVFDSPEDAVARIDDPALDIQPESVLVLRHAGPVAAGMPEAAALPIPRRLARGGVTDMVRISDGRMSSTAFGTVVLHCAPEAAAGGPLALVCDGDLIELNVDKRRIDLLVEAAELVQRSREYTPPPRPKRGYRWLHARHVESASSGADLDFL